MNLNLSVTRLLYSSTRSAVVILLGLGLVIVSCTAAEEPLPGPEGIGDPYFETLGNGGYDVQNYLITLEVEPLSNEIAGSVVISAEASDALSSFNLDLSGLVIDHVTVNEVAAKFSRAGSELTITPAQALEPEDGFEVVVAYHGNPEALASVASTFPEDRVGWFHAEVGAINVMSEPNGAATWFPVNDHPRDKASYRFEISVPKPYVVVASGILIDTIDEGDRVRHIWKMNEPMASYLASINIGDYELEVGPQVAGVMIRSYFPKGFDQSRKTGYEKIPEMLEFFTGLFGPYPFPAYGVIITNKNVTWCSDHLLHALENQSISNHCPDILSGMERFVAHELAHQWYGNSVSVMNWQDIWLKEGLASYAEWLWLARDGGFDAVSSIIRRESGIITSASLIGRPPPDGLYNDSVYQGSARLFHALRTRLGDEVFFNILQTYAERFQYANASTDDFIDIAEEVSDEDLGEFFDLWLYNSDWQNNDWPATS